MGTAAVLLRPTTAFLLAIGCLSLSVVARADDSHGNAPPVVDQDNLSCEVLPEFEEDVLSCDQLPSRFSAKSRRGFNVSRTPAMIGDFFGGTPTGLRGNIVLDRLLVAADDLDAPAPLPGGGSTLTISESGPVGIFQTSLGSIQDIQQLLRNGNPLPAPTNVGAIANNATLTTILTVAQIQSLLASTPQGYDIITLAAPPTSYEAAVNAIFLGRSGLTGTTVWDANGSGALLQGGDDALNGGEDFDAYYFYDYQLAVNLPLTDASSGGVGRLKIAEGGSVLPQDRVFFRYSYFDDVAYSTNGLGISRFTPGFERTFLDGLLSFELRAPIASGTMSEVTTDGTRSFGSTDSRFGNLTMYAKALLWQRERLAVSGGLGLSLPTADDISISLPGQSPLLAVENQAVHLQPFLGTLWMPTDRLYVHGFTQFDFAANGNNVQTNLDGNGLIRNGTLTDSNNIFLDWGLGYWAYRSNAARGLTGVIPTVEIHHTSSLNEGDVVNAGPLQLGNFSGETHLTNFVAGTTFEFAKQARLTAAYAGPFDGAQRQFDGAFRVMLSYQR